MSEFTEFERWGNGGEEPNQGYSKSLLRGKFTAHQFAAILGINQGGARDIMSGRRTGVPLGVKVKGTWFIDCDVAWAEHLRRRP